ncbi:DUF308 domain-containing protein [Candidatus Woesearchaeota archaeon]|nr:DUF308 domain-containing protein [Candidatus Woesearchaeota archaeon]
MRIKKAEFRITGIIFIIGGILSLLFPFFSSVGFELFIASIFIISGIIHLVLSIRAKRPEGFIYSIIFGILYALTGVLLFLFPIKGLIIITVFLTAMFILSGIFKTIFWIILQDRRNILLALINGLFVILLGVTIMAFLPLSAYYLIGILAGIELLITGTAFLMAR